MFIQTFNIFFSVAKQVWKNIVSKYFSRSGRKTIRKIDLPVLFNELYNSALTPKQVNAGFIRTGIWPFDPTAMQGKVVKQRLTTKQLDPLQPTTKYYIIFFNFLKYSFSSLIFFSI
jgi:hypothetical protein